MKKRLVLKNKYFIMLTIISIMVCISIVFMASYAFFTTRVETKDFVIHTGELIVNYQRGNNTINLENVYPISDSDGLNSNPHTFTITNTGSIDARYLVRLETDNTIIDSIPLEYIKISYSVNNGNYSDPILLSDLNSNLSFYKSNTLSVSSIDTISIKMWIDLDAPNEIANKQFKARIVVDSIQDVDDGFVVDTAPIIHLNKDSNGNYDLVLPIGSTYTELGISKVEDDKDNISISSVNKTYQFFNGIDIVDIESINMNNAGIYYITYTVTDSYGNTGKSVRQVIVSNNKNIPSISLNGDSVVEVGLCSTYIESGVNIDSNNRLLTFGSVDTNKLGTYIIRYIVIDDNGNMNSITRTVNVNEKLTFGKNIIANNTLVTSSPTLTTSSNETSDLSGLYSSTATNSGNPTYYFRGNVENNYVSFADFTWRIVRINEDGTVRLILQDGINNATYRFNLAYNNVNYMYYTNSDTIKPTVDSWYTNNLASYSDKIATGDYFCEQAKVKYSSSFTSGSATMAVYTDYTPDFKCSTDGNGKGIVNSNIGLITYDEMVYAGGYYNKSNSAYYLNNGVSNYWSMSPVGFDGISYIAWGMSNTGKNRGNYVSFTDAVRPVINLNADIAVTGTGTSTDPYVVE